MSFAAKVLSRRHLRRRHWAGLGFITLFLVWSLLWLVTARQFNKALDGWVEAARAEGIAFDYASRYTNGSPFAVHVHFDGLSVGNGKSATLRAKESVFYMGLFNWRSVSGKLRKSVEGKIGTTPFSADAIKFGFALPRRQARHHTETGLALWLHPFGLTLKEIKPVLFGDTIREAMIDMRIMGAAPDFSDKESVKAWNEAGGVIEFDRFYLNWGPMIVTATGTMGLDPKLQPEGAFSGRIEGLGAAIAALVGQGTIDKRQESLLRSSLNVLSRPSGLTGSSAPIVPISVQSGGLFLGPVRLLTIPELEW